MSTETQERTVAMKKKGISLRNFNMPDDLYNKFKSIAKLNKRTATAEFEVAVENHIKIEEKKKRD